jgi:uncharacterized protein (DUF849 family)
MTPPLPKVLITAAVAGNLTAPDQTPHLPITPWQIADGCLNSAEAGTRPEIELFDSGDIAMLHGLQAWPWRHRVDGGIKSRHDKLSNVPV